MGKIISGIQQIGIGNPNMQEAWKWYRTYFGMDIPVLEEAAEAALMTRYTRDKVESRNACIAINLNGGGGFEIWQYASRTPEGPAFELRPGDYGIYITKMKSPQLHETHAWFKAEGLDVLTSIQKDPAGTSHFFMRDLYGNIFQIEEAYQWFSFPKDRKAGGSSGVTIGVSDMDKALELYATVLGFNKLLYDVKGSFEDLASLPSGNDQYHRILLTHAQPLQGPFSEMLGSVKIELIQALDQPRLPIFKDRIWGDLGFIHLCFDVRNMDDLKADCERHGFPFTIDSENSFDMGQAAGRFSYIEDPDGTLIEFVESHKLPVMKRLGWYFDLDHRDQTKPLPRWMLKALRFTRKRD
jgi:catechol 2,3-dioxygenase-like lactoylglutathione lyase family enzyme